MLLTIVLLVAMLYAVYENGIGRGVNIGRLQILEENSVRAGAADVKFTNTMNETIDTIG